MSASSEEVATVLSIFLKMWGTNLKLLWRRLVWQAEIVKKSSLWQPKSRRSKVSHTRTLSSWLTVSFTRRLATCAWSLNTVSRVILLVAFRNKVLSLSLRTLLSHTLLWSLSVYIRFTKVESYTATLILIISSSTRVVLLRLVTLALLSTSRSPSPSAQSVAPLVTCPQSSCSSSIWVRRLTSFH